MVPFAMETKSLSVLHHGSCCHGVLSWSALSEPTMVPFAMETKSLSVLHHGFCCHGSLSSSALAP